MNGELLELIDDPVQVPDDTVLYRRVDWDIIGGRKACGAGDVATLRANAFRDYNDEHAAQLGFAGPCMSVGASTILAAMGFDADVILNGFPGYGLAKVQAGSLRNLVKIDGSPCPQGIMLAPTEGEPWHAVVFDRAGGKRTEAVAKAIARVAEWEIPLVNV